AQALQQVYGAADLETARRGQELALGVQVPPREEVAQADHGRRREGKHDGSSSSGAFAAHGSLRTRRHGAGTLSPTAVPDREEGMTGRSCLAVLSTAVLLLVAARADEEKTFPARVLIIRHAEKPPDEAMSADLSAAGKERAAALPGLFK